MNLVLESEMLPLRQDDEGTIRVGMTRVTLETVVESIEVGCTPEETVQQFPTLALADVYLVFGFYLRHREMIEASYLAPRRQQAEELQRAVLGQEGQAGLRARLQARLAAQPNGRNLH